MYPKDRRMTPLCGFYRLYRTRLCAKGYRQSLKVLEHPSHEKQPPTIQSAAELFTWSFFPA